jgi:hypothetical protein
MSVLGSGPADAAAGKSVKAKNADVLVTCTLTVLKVNPSDGTAQIRVTAQAQPNNLFGYSNNAYTQAFCSVYDIATNQLVLYAPFRNGATLPTTSITPIVPYSSFYYLCAQGFVKKTNGSQSYTPAVCG